VELGDPVGGSEAGYLANEKLFKLKTRLVSYNLSFMSVIELFPAKGNARSGSQQGNDAMNDECDTTPELQAWAVQLGDHDWRQVGEAATALACAGQVGLAAVLWGLSHPNARVRRGCAGFLDHHATDACIPQLREVALHDPASSVRRVAVHSATCQQCKPSPLSGDLVDLLIQVAQSDPNRRVRENAIGELGFQRRDARAVAALEQILRTETHPDVRRTAHHALKSQDPDYKARVDTQARERGIAAGRERREQRLLRHARQKS
jgi:HEAT repeat protein